MNVWADSGGHPYVAPSITTWCSEELNTISASMSGGGTGSSSSSRAYKYVYLLFKPITLEVDSGTVSLGIDHTAFFIERADGLGHFYSFATNPKAVGLSFVTGCEGRLSTYVKKDSNSRFTQAYLEITNITRKGTVDLTDQMSDTDTREVKYDPDEGYYRYLRLNLGSSPKGDIAGPGVECGASLIRSKNLSDPRQYSLLWSNCCDCALECFAWSTNAPIQVQYDTTVEKIFAASLVAALLVSLYPLLQEVGFLLGEGILVSGVPTIPNVVFENFEKATIKDKELGSLRMTF